MRREWTDAAERHRLLPAEREAFERARRGDRLPSGWSPIEGSQPALWVGPGLTIARLSCGLFDLIEGGEARALLVRHAFRVTHAQRMQLNNLLPPGTPIPKAIAALAAAYPEFELVTSSATGALLMRPPQAVLACDGKHGGLDALFWHEGERAIDLVFQYGRSRPRPSHQDSSGPGGAPRDTAAAGAPEQTGRGRSGQPRIPGTAAPQDPARGTPDPIDAARTLRFPLAWSESQRLRRGLALIATGALAGPLLSLPLLAFDAVVWLIGCALLWVIAIPLGRSWLERWEARAERPSIELQDHWLRVPHEGRIQHIDLRTTTCDRSWQGPIHASPKHGGTRPPVARLHLRGPEVDLLLAAPYVAREPGFPEDPSPAPRANCALELLPADFRRLVAQL